MCLKMRLNPLCACNRLKFKNPRKIIEKNNQKAGFYLWNGKYTDRTKKLFYSFLRNPVLKFSSENKKKFLICLIFDMLNFLCAEVS